MFRNSKEAVFLERPNRYMVKASAGSKIIDAYCPNPGRLIEIFTSGRRLILEKSTGAKRKTAYTVVGAYYSGKVIPLYSARANSIAENLIIPELFPEYKHLRREVLLGRSRIDFKLTERDIEIYLEVKACTLVERELAMFPDAPTKRGLKHMMELAGIKDRGAKSEGHILFVVMNPDALEFMPNMHTDFNFSKAMLKLAGGLKYHCVSICTEADGNVMVKNFNLPFNIRRLSANLPAGGVYLLIIHTVNRKIIEPGSLGEIILEPGYYIYTGSALKNLEKRIARHLRKFKKKHWHIDFLTSEAEKIKAYPIRTTKRLECSLAQAVAETADNSIPGFGSSGCKCGSHLFYFREDPEKDSKFLNLLFLYRHDKALQ
ncbi:MAG: DNA/RNA nuclease SfsA [Spirochaetes bacterium]|nr:DNA/RNA nuclease SfsA [Spirochaetota bacterium]